MAFIRRKIVNGRAYLYEVESHRDDSGTVRQKVVRYIGPEDPVYATARAKTSGRSKTRRPASR